MLQAVSLIISILKILEICLNTYNILLYLFPRPCTSRIDILYPHNDHFREARESIRWVFYEILCSSITVKGG